MAEKYEIKMSLDASAVKEELSKVEEEAKKKMVEITGSITKAVEVSLADEMGKIAKSTVALFDLIPKEIQSKVPGITSVINKIDIASKVQKESKTVISSIGKIVKGFTDYKDAVKVASVAQDGLSFLKMADGISLAVGVITALTVGLVEYVTAQEKANNVMKQYGEVSKNSRDVTEELARQGNADYKENMKSIDLYKSYNQELLSLIDSDGKIIGNKERVNFLVEQLNKEFPNSIKYLDDEKTKIDNQCKSIENLIMMKQAQYKLESMEPSYMDAISKQDEDRELLANMEKERNERKSELAEAQKAWDAFVAKGGDIESYEAASLMSKVGAAELGINEANKKIQEQIDIMNTRNDTIESYEGLMTAVHSGDETAIEKQINQMDGWYEAKATLNKDYNQKLTDQHTKTVEDLAEYDRQVNELGIKSNEAERKRLEDRVELSKQELDIMDEFRKYRQEQGIEEKQEQADAEGDTYKEAILAAFQEAGQDQISQATLDATAAILKIQGVAENAIVPSVVIPVYYELQNAMPSGGGGSGTSNSEFMPMSLDLESFPINTPVDYLHVSAEQKEMSLRSSDLVSGISNAVSRNVTAFKIPSMYSHVKETPVTVHQSNNFYQPIERPSDVTRKIEQVNKSLLKRR